MLSLYYRPMACSLACRIAIMEAGLEAEYISVDLANKRTQGGEDFFEVSHKGKVPALILDDGSLLTENIAVLNFIASKAPAGKLAPSPGTPEYYVFLEWLSFISTELHKQCLYPAFMQGATEATIEYAKSKINDQLAIVDNRLKSNEYIAGETFTVADAYLVWALSLASLAGGQMDNFPSIKKYSKRVFSRPKVNQAVDLEREMALGKTA